MDCRSLFIYGREVGRMRGREVVEVFDEKVFGMLFRERREF